MKIFDIVTHKAQVSVYGNYLQAFSLGGQMSFKTGAAEGGIKKACGWQALRGDMWTIEDSNF
ncbi:hypothetical protein G9409_00330 [Chlorobium sp. BLA1]|uniref:hypothetical protein n=1 Tax=Candidatus Chlorobium masyuteum TaxID=2716876 RepID=UPI00141E924A|nr:hypothetical protein [Candidatus Chlorobium masyuteum]NHQ59046.1 hypothetical protein [Candidatus Chlorobium masyuteum]